MPELVTNTREPYWRSECGGYEVWCTDCTALPSACFDGVDGILTDPPYGIGFAARPTKSSRERGRQPEEWDDVAPDVRPWLVFGCPTMVWGGNHFELPASRGWLVWAKPDGFPTFGNAELCWTNVEMPVRHLDCDRCNVDKVDHPTQKPVMLMEWCLGFMPSSRRVLDPYMGSGTTGVACVNSGRRFIGVERESKYCKIAVGRIQRAMMERGLTTKPSVDELCEADPVR